MANKTEKLKDCLLRILTFNETLKEAAESLLKDVDKTSLEQIKKSEIEKKRKEEFEDRKNVYLFSELPEVIALVTLRLTTEYTGEKFAQKFRYEIKKSKSAYWNILDSLNFRVIYNNKVEELRYDQFTRLVQTVRAILKVRFGLKKYLDIRIFLGLIIFQVIDRCLVEFNKSKRKSKLLESETVSKAIYSADFDWIFKNSNYVYHIEDIEKLIFNLLSGKKQKIFADTIEEIDLWLKEE